MITFSNLNNIIYGRLGNKLFQIAATIGIAQKNGHTPGFPDWGYSKYFKNKLPLLPPSGKLKVYTQKGQSYSDVTLDLNIDWDLHGFFQSEKFFIHTEELIRYYLEPSTELNEYIKNKYGTILGHKTCSVHVRRGDYLIQQQYFPSQPAEYYRKAMEKIGPGTTFLIFSDDIDWCKLNFTGDGLVFVEDENDITDLFLMSKCNDHIISNSSFSWWGAWLDPNPQKTIICPEHWFGIAVAFDLESFEKDIFAHNFQKLILPKNDLVNKYPKIFRPLFVIYYRVPAIFTGSVRYALKPVKKILKTILKPNA